MYINLNKDAYEIVYNTQLLCTFAHKTDVDLILDYIKNVYATIDRQIFIFSNQNDDSELFCTYNIDKSERHLKVPSTISIHRKKDTNTLYTVNALNLIIQKSNNGVLDKSFIINWEVYTNSLILTNGSDVRIIKLHLFKRIEL